MSQNKKDPFVSGCIKNMKEIVLDKMKDVKMDENI